MSRSYAGLALVGVLFAGLFAIGADAPPVAPMPKVKVEPPPDKDITADVKKMPDSNGKVGLAGFSNGGNLSAHATPLDPNIDAERDYVEKTLCSTGLVGQTMHFLPDNPMKEAKTATGGSFPTARRSRTSAAASRRDARRCG